MANNKTIELEVNVTGKGIKELKSELREMQSQIAAATDPEKAQAFAAAAGQIRDRITEVNEQIRVFATGSKFEQVSNGLGLIKDQLMSLDFEGAAENARNLTANIKSMDPKAVAAGFKGLITTVGQLGNAFFQMGLKLLANPIFLIVAVIVAVVAAIILLKDKIKILQQAFDFLMIPIKATIQALKDLTDWLGITSFAAEENADRTIAANKKKQKSDKEYVDNKIAELDREIKVAKAAGKDTTEFELEQARIRRASANERIRDNAKVIKEINELEANGNTTLSDDRKKARDEARDELKKAQNEFRDNLAERDAIIAGNNKEAADKRKAANTQEAAELKRQKDALRNIEQKYLDEIKALEATTDSERLALQKEKDQRELDAIKLSKEEKLKAQQELDKKYALEENAINKAKADKNAEIAFDYAQKLKDLQAQTLLDEYARQLERDAIEEEKVITDLEKQGATAEQVQAVRDYYDQLALDRGKEFEEKQEKEDEEATDKKIELTRKERDARIAMVGQIGNALTAFSELAGENTAMQKGLAVAGATMATFESAVNAYNGMTEAIPGPIGIAAGVAAAAASVAMGIANVKKILAVKVPGKNSGAGGGSVGGAQTNFAPSFNLGGGAPSEANTARAAQPVEAGRGAAPGETTTVRAVVVESDVTATQGRVARYNSSAEL